MPKVAGKGKNKKKKNGKNGNPLGRPTKYHPSYCVIAESLARRGITTIDELVSVFGVSRATMYNWLNEHPAFLDSLRTNRFINDAEVESELLKRCRGYEVTEKEIHAGRDEKGKEVINKVVYKTKHIEASEQAQIFWLSNRSQDWDRAGREVQDTRRPQTYMEMVLATAKARGADVDFKTN